MEKVQTAIYTVWASMLTLLALIPFADPGFFSKDTLAIGGYAVGFSFGIAVMILWVVAICYWTEKF